MRRIFLIVVIFGVSLHAQRGRNSNRHNWASTTTTTTSTTETPFIDTYHNNDVDWDSSPSPVAPPANQIPVGTILEQTLDSVTFVSSNVTSEQINTTFWQNQDVIHVAQKSSDFDLRNHRFLQGSSFVSGTLPALGLVHTVLESYKNHHKLVLRPDDIWTAILVQFSLYINANAEQLRSYFVNHNGSQTLTVCLDALNFPRENMRPAQWAVLVNGMKSQMARLTKANVTEWMENRFSTTTETDIIASKVILMSAMQHYFQYELNVRCGIPEITLMGTEADWELVLNKVQGLRQYGDIPNKWADLLTPVVQQFINTTRGQVDAEFYQDIVRIQSLNMCAGDTTKSLDGWITVFAVFDRKGEWKGDKQPRWKWPKVLVHDVPSGVATVPIRITKDMGSRGRWEGDAIIFAGHMGQVVSWRGDGYRPYIGWAIAQDNTIINARVARERDYRTSY